MRRKKANVLDFDRVGIEYFQFIRVKNDAGITGTRYILTRRLTENQLNFLLYFKNVIVSTCSAKYAPEIVHDTIILADKCL